jgi:5-formyltetrahydrofolate cyclo-ligase
VDKAKQLVRGEIVATRKAMPHSARVSAAAALTDLLLSVPEVAKASTVAAYVAMGTEPDTSAILAALRSRGAVVLLPILRPDCDLDWAPYAGVHALSAGSRGLREPTGPRLGSDAPKAAGAILVPALAVDRQRGHRLGRGGGSYDRVLARVSDEAFTCALVYDGELRDGIPVEPHDRPVAAAATPSGLTRF